MSLNEAANLTKKALAYFVLFLVLYLIGENLIKGANFIYKKSFPDPPAPPTISFGKINILDIPTLPVDLSTVEYRKELPSTTFPKFAPNIRVYEIEKPRVSVEKEERFKSIATDLGFKSFAIKTSDSERLWVDNTNQRKFKADVFFETHELTTKPEYLEQTINKGYSPGKAQAVKAAKEYFAITGVLDSELNQAEYTVEGVKITEGIKKQTPLPTLERLKFVNITPKKISHVTTVYDKRGKPTNKEHFIKVFSPNPKISNVNAFVKLEKNKATASDALYNYYKTSGNYGTYPIITTKKAWQLLTENKASLVYIKEAGADLFAPNESINNINKIDIRSIELGYYTSTTVKDYIQPIYVFRGKFKTTDRKSGDVVFYLPAIDPNLDK